MVRNTLVDRGGKVPLVPDLDKFVLVTAAHEVDHVTGGDDPPEFLCAGIGDRQPAEPAFRHRCDGADNALRGRHGNNVPCRDRHHLAFLLYDMGLELDRAPIEFSLHFQEPVTLLGGPPVLVRQRSSVFFVCPGLYLHPTGSFFMFVSGPFDSGTGSPDGFLCIVPL